MIPPLPKVTVAVPLYRSGRFLPIVTETLRTFEYPNLEIIVSDRHHLDDAFDQLRNTFGADPRFRFMLAEDQMDWVSHYNLLLQEASGDYFLWASHDDSYSANYLAKLAQALDDHPDAIVAYSEVERITLDGEPHTHRLPTGADNRRSPGAISAYFVAMSGGQQFHGLFRRKALIDRQLFIRPTVQNIAADMLWVYTLCVIARTRQVSGCTFWKRYYPSSTHRLWKQQMRPVFMWNFAQVTGSYLDDYAPNWIQRFLGKSLAYSACTAWMLKLSLQRWSERIQGAREG